MGNGTRSPRDKVCTIKPANLLHSPYLAAKFQRCLFTLFSARIMANILHRSGIISDVVFLIYPSLSPSYRMNSILAEYGLNSTPRAMLRY